MSDRIWRLVESVVEGLGYDLWGLELAGAGKRTMLRVYIDQDAGVDIDDCAKVSRQLSSVLDVEDPIDGHYTLEVSSPGLDRRLFRPEQYEKLKGSRVKIHLRSPWEGRKRYQGLLCGLEGEDVVLRSGDEEYLFPLAEIDKARLVVDIE